MQAQLWGPGSRPPSPGYGDPAQAQLSSVSRERWSQTLLQARLRGPNLGKVVPGTQFLHGFHLLIQVVCLSEATQVRVIFVSGQCVQVQW